MIIRVQNHAKHWETMLPCAVKGVITTQGSVVPQPFRVFPRNIPVTFRRNSVVHLHVYVRTLASVRVYTAKCTTKSARKKIGMTVVL